MSSNEPHIGCAGELVIPFEAARRFRWWEAKGDDAERARRFAAAREAAGMPE